MPRPLYSQEREPVPHSSGAWVCPRAQNLFPPTGNAHVTINIYFVMLFLHVPAPVHLQGSYLEGTHL